MAAIFSQLGAISVAQFLRDYWQRQPLLIPQAFPHFQSPIDANELAGLALEDFVESRLVMSDDWSVKHGPFSEVELSNLPSDSPWTLLVQGVDQLVPAVAELLDAFRFLPSWRLDDIMASFATDGGGVGAHFDQYDVFLLQAQGRRRWQLGKFCDADEPLLENNDLAILKNFNQEQEYILEPGDMLYLPPGLAHWGTAIGDCMTYSIGFRAPSTQEIISGFCDDRLEQLESNERFRDNTLPADHDCYRIPDSVIERLRQDILAVIDDKTALAEWFGRFASTPRYQELEFQAEESVQAVADITAPLHKQPAARFAYYGQGDEATLFVNGQQWLVSVGFARWLCCNQNLKPRDFAEQVKTAGDETALLDLLRQGYLQLA